jgi:hypothetical protein
MPIGVRSYSSGIQRAPTSAPRPISGRPCIRPAEGWVGPRCLGRPPRLIISRSPDANRRRRGEIRCSGSSFFAQRSPLGSTLRRSRRSRRRPSSPRSSRSPWDRRNRLRRARSRRPTCRPHRRRFPRCRGRLRAIAGSMWAALIRVTGIPTRPPRTTKGQRLPTARDTRSTQRRHIGRNTRRPPKRACRSGPFARATA